LSEVVERKECVKVHHIAPVRGKEGTAQCVVLWLNLGENQGVNLLVSI